MWLLGKYKQTTNQQTDTDTDTANDTNDTYTDIEYIIGKLFRIVICGHVPDTRVQHDKIILEGRTEDRKWFTKQIIYWYQNKLNISLVFHKSSCNYTQDNG